MSNLAFLLVAVAVSVVASLFLWVRTRKPKTFMSSIEEFQTHMDALSFDQPDGRRRARGEPLEPIVPAPESGDLARKLREARRLSGDEHLDGGSER